MSLKLTISDIKQVYSLLKQKAQEEYALGHYAKAWHVMNEAVSLIQEFNWEYTDDDLEKLLQQLSAQWIPTISVNYMPNENRVVVLDDWCTSYVLVLQYLDALVAAGKEILYITSRDIQNSNHKNIISRISHYPKLTYQIISNTSLPIDKWLSVVYDRIITYAPSKVIAHIGSCSWFLPVIARLPKDLPTYRSNLDDQCFWLGRSVIDYSLEFRPFGVAVSRERRKLKPEQQLYVDPDYTYWNLVKQVLHDNPKAVLLFATKNGLRTQQDFLDQFVKENHLEKQFVFIGFRSDINEVFAHCDIFLGTCPVCGSLTSQLAAMNHKPILQYYLPGTDDDETEQALNYNNPNLQWSFSDKEAFLAEAKRLINDPDYRQQQGELAYQSTIKPEQFNQVFMDAITTNIAPCPTKKVDYDEVARRWFWPEQMGFDDHIGWLVPMLKREGLINKMPMLHLKFNYQRFVVQKLFSVDWYKYKLGLK